MTGPGEAPVFCFTANVYATGRSGFWIPMDVKRAMGWTLTDHLVGYIIFDKMGKTLQHGIYQTISGGEVYMPELLSNGQVVQVAMFWPPDGKQDAVC